jgi:ACS family hexuronate transporter-like MFS transporter
VERTRTQAWVLALVATSTMAISYVDRQTLAVLAPTVTKALAIDETAYGWLASAFSIAYLVAAPLAGRAIDRVGARRGLLVAVIVWSVIAAAHAGVAAYGQLFALRIALGIAESPSFPGAAQTVHRSLPPGERARGFGVLFVGSSIGSMIAPPLATWLATRYSWRVAFIGTAVVGLAWIPAWLGVAWAKRARPILDRPAEDDAATAAHKPRVMEIATHPAVLRATLVVAAVAPTIGFVLNWGSKFLERHHGIGIERLGPFLVLPPLFYDVGSIAFGDLASRRAKKRKDGSAPDRLLFASALAVAATMVMVVGARSAWEAIAWASVSLAGCGGVFALLTADMMARVPPSAISLAGGLSAAAQSLALIVANPLVGRVVDRTGSYTLPILALSAWIVPGCIAWIVWDPRRHALRSSQRIAPST